MTVIENGLGTLLKQRRTMMMLTQRKLGILSGISSSYIGRIEKGERHPSASLLRKLAGPLDFSESEILSLAGFLSPKIPIADERKTSDTYGHLDPYVSLILSREPAEVQRAVLGILDILKSLGKTLNK
jgi:transcriptional regulator with XRE-family HTH domain